MKFSIISICLNDKSNLKATLASIEQQTFNDFEHIVVDGGSTDGTRELLEARARSHTNFRFISEKDSGIYNAMNKGIGLSHGEYLLFLNSGDLLANPEALSTVSKLSKGQEFIYTDIFLKTESGFIHRHYPKKLSFRFWLSEHLCHQAVYFKKTLFERLGKYDESYRCAADHEFFLRALFKGKASTLHIPHALAIYQMDGLSSQEKMRDRIIGEMARSQHAHLMNFKTRVYGTRLRLYQFLQSIGSVGLRRFSQLFLGLFSARLSYEDQVLDVFSSSLPSNSRLKDLIINTHELTGGAAIATNRLHQALLKRGVDSRMLVLYKSSNDPSVYKAWPKRGWARIREAFNYFLELFLRKISVGLGKRWGLSTLGIESYADIKGALKFHNPDVVHLNWTCDRFISIEALGEISKAIVWTFHDMWPFCGAEHVSYGSRHLEGYTKANSKYAGARFDIDRRVWNRKKKSFSSLQANSIITTPSHWMQNQVQQSPIFKNFKVKCVPNGYSPEIYFPRSKEDSRNSLGISKDKKVILFGAVDVSADPNKGFLLLVEALNFFKTLPSTHNYELVVFGHFHPEHLKILPYPVKALGYFSNSADLATAYSAADLFVIPSKLESFGLSAVEAMACGAPVLCFDSSGLKDIVDHKTTGYRAKAFDTNEFAEGMSWILENNERHQNLSKAGLEKVLKEFNIESVADRFIDIYNKNVRQS